MNKKKLYIYIVISIIAGIGLFFYDKTSFYDYIKIMGTAFLVCLFFLLQNIIFLKNKKVGNL